MKCIDSVVVTCCQLEKVFNMGATLMLTSIDFKMYETREEFDEATFYNGSPARGFFGT